MLHLENVRAGYGAVEVLQGVDLVLEPGRILGLLGRNGAGKTTTIRAIMGLVDGLRGSIRIEDTELVGLPPHRVPGHGLAWVPQGRRLFAEMTVEENLRLGALAGRGESAERLDFLFDLFPVLKERMHTPARRLSGGQQQMVAMARALASGPRVLLLDEPTEGLQPSLVDRILEAVRELRAAGTTLLLVEQKVEAALAVADRIAFIENGRIREHATPGESGAGPGAADPLRRGAQGGMTMTIRYAAARSPTPAGKRSGSQSLRGTIGLQLHWIIRRVQGAGQPEPPGMEAAHRCRFAL